MRKFASFLPGLFIVIITIASCSQEEKNNTPAKIFKSSPSKPAPVIPPAIKVKDIPKPDTIFSIPNVDSIRVPSDSANILKDSVIFSREQVMDSTFIQQIEPLRKPTFRQFRKYMQLHRRGPVV